MESSNSELNRSISTPVKHEHDTSTKLKTFSSEKIQCPSSPTQSFSPSDDHNDQIQEMEQTPSTYRTTSVPVKRTTTSAKLKTFSSEKIPSPTQPSSSSDDLEESPTEAPRTQEMERTPSGYRIPPSVFERSQSSSPMEWSTASNESLFSIHMGNMSFTNDQFCMMRSREVNPSEEASTSDHQFFSYDSGGDMRRHEIGLAEATMLEVIKESENQNQTKSLAEMRKGHRSEGSNTSNKSFAFSIIGAETGSSKRLHSSLRPNHEQTQTQAQPEAHVEAQTQAHVEAQTQPEPETPIEAGNQAQASWFSCFSCCFVSK